MCLELPEETWRTLTELWVPLIAIWIAAGGVVVTFVGAIASAGVAFAAWKTSVRATQIAEEAQQHERNRSLAAEVAQRKADRRRFVDACRKYFELNISHRAQSDSTDRFGGLEILSDTTAVDGAIDVLQDANRLLDETSGEVNWRNETSTERATRFADSMMVWYMAAEAWVIGAARNAPFIPTSDEAAEKLKNS